MNQWIPLTTLNILCFLAILGQFILVTSPGLTTLENAAPTSSCSTAVPEVTGSTAKGNGVEDFKFGLSQNFPDIQNGSHKVEEVELAAHGTLPNTPPPSKLPQNEAFVSLGFIALNELLEVAFFSELIMKIVESNVGFDNIPNRNETLSIFQVVQVQEELHELQANLAFKVFTSRSIEPCEYTFPVMNFKESIALASRFTSLVLGPLPNIQTIFMKEGDNELVSGVGSVLGQQVRNQPGSLNWPEQK